MSTYPPCPFCARTETSADRSPAGMYYACNYCCARGPLCDSEEKARAAWENTAIHDALRSALPFIRAAAEPTVSYGACIGDPRNFTPDPEWSTAEERAAHAEDCAALDRGEVITSNPVHIQLDMERSIAGQIKGADSAVLVRDDEGDIIGGHVTKRAYGVGVSSIRDEDAERSLSLVLNFLGVK